MTRIASIACAALFACAGSPSDLASPTERPAVSPDTVRVALTDLGAQTYRGFQGGLYPGGANTMPAAHDSAGVAARNAVRPLDGNGNPASSGKYVLLSIGMSNTTQEWCSQGSAPPCDSWSFTGRALADPSVNTTSLAIVNGAAGGQDAITWASPSAANYDRIRYTRLAPLGLTERQVQVVWLKLANARPTTPLPATNADAYVLLERLGNVVRALKSRYPNLQQVFVTSRIYAGYATSDLNPEPYAYESAFALKWLIQAQIDQQRLNIVDPHAGNVSYSSAAAPWIAWGPYPWADGLRARSDGLTWDRSEFSSDGTHPAQAGESKVALMLLNFFKTSNYTRCWFLAGSGCR